MMAAILRIEPRLPTTIIQYSIYKMLHASKRSDLIDPNAPVNLALLANCEAVRFDEARVDSLKSPQEVSFVEAIPLH